MTTRSAHSSAIWVLLWLSTFTGQAATFTGSVDSDWANSANWTGGYPADTDNAILDMTADLSRATPNSVLAIRVGTSGTGVLNVSSGADLSATANASGESRLGEGRGHSGTVNQSGGSVDINYLEVGREGIGSYFLTGGDCVIARGKSGNSVYLGTDDTKSVNGGTGTIEISGGSFKTRTGVHLGSANGSGVGTFSVLGDGALLIGIGSHSGIDGSWTQNSGSTLNVGIDLGGLTKILIDEVDGTEQAVTFEAGSLLDVGYYGNGYGGGTWTVMELQNGDITDNGLAFAPTVDTNIWSFAIDNSGANGLLTVSATGDPAPQQVDVTLTVGDTKKQIMRYGLDYERLWYWTSSLSAAEKDLVAQWSAVDCDVDYIRVAMNSGYELTEGTFNLSAYTNKIIPMMQDMKDANPDIKFFASPRPLNEAVSGASWQPYPLWVTGATTYTSGDYDFNDLKCAEYLIKYLLLMKSYGFKITYLDITNEWQSDFAGGRVTQADVRDIVQAFQDYLATPWSHPELPGLVLAADDIPLIVAPSAWSFRQGGWWIDSLNTQAKKDAIDIASCHNTDKTGTAQEFADKVATYCNPGTEIWNTEVHGWKSTSGANEVTTFSFMIEAIRAGFSGLNGWLAIGTTNQGHCYILNPSGTPSRNVKYFIFNKLSNTSNFGRALDINQPVEFKSTAALIRENLMTVWVINETANERFTEIDIGDRTIANPTITRTRWSESLPVEGVSDTVTGASNSTFQADIEGDSLTCFEIELVPSGSDFPFLEAENYTAMSGIDVQPCSDEGGGEMVAFSDSGDEVSFDVDVSRRGSYHVGFRVASATADIALELFDSSNLVARVSRIATGDPQNWTTIYRTIELDTGSTTLRVKSAGGGWNLNWIECTPLSVPSAPENMALNQAASASNVHSTGYEASKAVDGNPSTRWATSTSPAWLEVNFGVPTMVNKTSILDYGNRITSYEIQYFDRTWQTAYSGGNPEDNVEYDFPAVRARQFRLQTLTSTANPSVWEFGLYYDPYHENTTPATAIDRGPNSVSISWSGVPGSTYTLQRSTNLVTGTFTTLDSETPGLETTNTSTVAVPNDAAYYRLVVE